jgi:hypothetical protein
VTSALGCHAGTKTVGLGALPFVWLIRTFHGSSHYYGAGHIPRTYTNRAKNIRICRLGCQPATLITTTM